MDPAQADFRSPRQRFQELFEAVHHSGMLQDGKAFADALPNGPAEEILAAYRQQSALPGFDLQAFVRQHFTFPPSASSGFKSDLSRSPRQHIEALWEVLTRQPDAPHPGSSLIPLPYPYIVPGGRFNEIYYWDSYFTMLGLQQSGRIALMESMLNNFSWLIHTFGYIPNGNRTYFLGRSQPPFFALMVDLLAQSKGASIYLQYLPALEKEYAFWMQGKDELAAAGQAQRRVVRLPGGHVLNRYWDAHNSPREEMYADDVQLRARTPHAPEEFYRHIRAACESGWDFSSRWLRHPQQLGSIHSCDILPVDLNALLYFLEQSLTKAHSLAGHAAQAGQYEQLAEQRKQALLQCCWDETQGFFMDYDFVAQRPKEVLSLAGTFPLFFQMASDAQARACARVIEAVFLKPGGLVCTPLHTGQQWDAPNGWAPLHWMCIQGLRQYGLHPLADEIRNRWVTLNIRVYRQSGKMLEKYNVENPALKGGGGEYPVQDGFGWTNGVLLKLLSEMDEDFA